MIILSIINHYNKYKNKLQWCEKKDPCEKITTVKKRPSN